MDFIRLTEFPIRTSTAPCHDLGFPAEAMPFPSSIWRNSLKTDQLNFSAWLEQPFLAGEISWSPWQHCSQHSEQEELSLQSCTLCAHNIMFHLSSLRLLHHCHDQLLNRSHLFNEGTYRSAVAVRYALLALSPLMRSLWFLP